MNDLKDQQQTILHFLDAMARTASQHEFEKHMNLISKKVKVYGVPGFEIIGYGHWFNQCQNEFKEKLIKQVSYESLKVINSSDSMIMFTTTEHIETTENKKSATEIEVIITLEDDNLWRVTQERILSGNELVHDKNHVLN